jgi:hypothetical protein
MAEKSHQMLADTGRSLKLDTQALKLLNPEP